jgi:ADP-heptose:LPS heptosyltransferase
MGDVVVATSVLPVIKAAFPEAEIGFLVGSWARPILEGHPLVRWVHVLDHWKLNRRSSSWLDKWQRYRHTRAQALQEIKHQRYDIAVDLYYFFPNSIPLLWQAGIPVRVGYTSGGFGPLLTHPVKWQNLDQGVAQYHLRLLRERLPDLPVPSDLRPSLVAADADGRPLVSVSAGRQYIVLHVGAGSPLKEWPVDKWRRLAELLLHDGYQVIFTGAGAQDALVVSKVTDGLDGAWVNLCGQLAWQEYVRVLGNAALVIGVDTVAGHVAAAVGTPCVVIDNGMKNPYHWRPMSQRCKVLVHKVPCLPCYRTRGCRAMHCVRKVAVDAVYRAARELLGADSWG